MYLWSCSYRLIPHIQKGVVNPRLLTWLDDRWSCRPDEAAQHALVAQRVLGFPCVFLARNNIAIARYLGCSDSVLFAFRSAPPGSVEVAWAAWDSLLAHFGEPRAVLPRGQRLSARMGFKLALDKPFSPKLVSVLIDSLSDYPRGVATQACAPALDLGDASWSAAQTKLGCAALRAAGRRPRLMTRAHDFKAIGVETKLRASDLNWLTQRTRDL